MQITNLPFGKIRIDGGTQPRESIDAQVVSDYAEQIRAGAEFPPVIVYHDGEHNWLADGFHRRAGYAAAGRDDVPAEIRQGTQRDAILYSVGANAAHGLRRTNADKRRAVMRLLEDQEWSKWSDREIAKRCGVDGKTVAGLRPVLSAEVPQIERKAERNGKTYEMNTSRIGTSKPAKSAPRLSNEGSQSVPEDEGDVAVMDEPEHEQPAESIKINDIEIVMNNPIQSDSEDDETDPETGKPYPPVPPNNIFKDVKESPEMRARALIIGLHGHLVRFHDDGILSGLKSCPIGERREVADSLRAEIHSINELISELESTSDKANENKDRSARRRVG